MDQVYESLEKMRVKEEPFIVHKGELLDLHFERMPLSSREKEKLKAAFESKGVLGKSGGEWLFVGPQGIRPSTRSERLTLPKLMDDWERYMEEADEEGEEEGLASKGYPLQPTAGLGTVTTEATRMQIQKEYDKVASVYGRRQAIDYITRAFKLRNVKVSSGGQVVGYEVVESIVEAELPPEAEAVLRSVLGRANRTVASAKETARGYDVLLDNGKALSLSRQRVRGVAPGETEEKWIVTHGGESYDPAAPTDIETLSKLIEEVTPEKEKMILDYIARNPELDDPKFHEFVERQGIDPHEAEEVVYRRLHKLLRPQEVTYTQAVTPSPETIPITKHGKKVVRLPHLTFANQARERKKKRTRVYRAMGEKVSTIHAWSGSTVAVDFDTEEEAKKFVAFALSKGVSRNNIEQKYRWGVDIWFPEADELKTRSQVEGWLREMGVQLPESKITVREMITRRERRVNFVLRPHEVVALDEKPVWSALKEAGAIRTTPFRTAAGDVEEEFFEVEIDTEHESWKTADKAELLDEVGSITKALRDKIEEADGMKEQRRIVKRRYSRRSRQVCSVNEEEGILLIPEDLKYVCPVCGKKGKMEDGVPPVCDKCLIEMLPVEALEEPEETKVTEPEQFNKDEMKEQEEATVTLDMKTETGKTDKDYKDLASKLKVLARRWGGRLEGSLVTFPSGTEDIRRFAGEARNLLKREGFVRSRVVVRESQVKEDVKGTWGVYPGFIVAVKDRSEAEALEEYLFGEKGVVVSTSVGDRVILLLDDPGRGQKDLEGLLVGAKREGVIEGVKEALKGEPSASALKARARRIHHRHKELMKRWKSEKDPVKKNTIRDEIAELKSKASVLHDKYGIEVVGLGKTPLKVEEALKGVYGPNQAFVVSLDSSGEARQVGDFLRDKVTTVQNVGDQVLVLLAPDQDQVDLKAFLDDAREAGAIGEARIKKLAETIQTSSRLWKPGDTFKMHVAKGTEGEWVVREVVGHVGEGDASVLIYKGPVGEKRMRHIEIDKAVGFKAVVPPGEVKEARVTGTPTYSTMMIRCDDDAQAREVADNLRRSTDVVSVGQPDERVFVTTIHTTPQRGEEFVRGVLMSLRISAEEVKEQAPDPNVERLERDPGFSRALLKYNRTKDARDWEEVRRNAERVIGGAGPEIGRALGAYARREESVSEVERVVPTTLPYSVVTVLCDDDEEAKRVAEALPEAYGVAGVKHKRGTGEVTVTFELDDPRSAAKRVADILRKKGIEVRESQIKVEQFKGRTITYKGRKIKEPTLLKSLAKKAGVSIDKAMRLWAEAQFSFEKAHPEIKKGTSRYYKGVSGFLKARLQLPTKRAASVGGESVKEQVLKWDSRRALVLADKASEVSDEMERFEPGEGPADVVNLIGSILNAPLPEDLKSELRKVYSRLQAAEDWDRDLQAAVGDVLERASVVLRGMSESVKEDELIQAGEYVGINVEELRDSGVGEDRIELLVDAAARVERGELKTLEEVERFLKYMFDKMMIRDTFGPRLARRGGESVKEFGEELPLPSYVIKLHDAYLAAKEKGDEERAEKIKGQIGIQLKMHGVDPSRIWGRKESAEESCLKILSDDDDFNKLLDKFQFVGGDQYLTQAAARASRITALRPSKARQLVEQLIQKGS